MSEFLIKIGERISVMIKWILDDIRDRFIHIGDALRILWDGWTFFSKVFIVTVITLGLIVILFFSPIWNGLQQWRANHLLTESQVVFEEGNPRQAYRLATNAYLLNADDLKTVEWLRQISAESRWPVALHWADLAMQLDGYTMASVIKAGEIAYYQNNTAAVHRYLNFLLEEFPGTQELKAFEDLIRGQANLVGEEDKETTLRDNRTIKQSLVEGEIFRQKFEPFRAALKAEGFPAWAGVREKVIPMFRGKPEQMGKLAEWLYLNGLGEILISEFNYNQALENNYLFRFWLLSQAGKSGSYGIRHIFEGRDSEDFPLSKGEFLIIKAIDALRTDQLQERFEFLFNEALRESSVKDLIFAQAVMQVVNSASARAALLEKMSFHPGLRAEALLKLFNLYYVSGVEEKLIDLIKRYPLNTLAEEPKELHISACYIYALLKDPEDVRTDLEDKLVRHVDDFGYQSALALVYFRLKEITAARMLVSKAHEDVQKLNMQQFLVTLLILKATGETEYPAQMVTALGNELHLPAEKELLELL